MDGWMDGWIESERERERERERETEREREREFLDPNILSTALGDLWEMLLPHFLVGCTTQRFKL